MTIKELKEKLADLPLSCDDKEIMIYEGDIYYSDLVTPDRLIVEGDCIILR